MYTLILFNEKKSRFFILLAGENVILNRETEIAKALWSPGTYHHRALDCFRTLKLKSGGLISRLYRVSDVERVKRKIHSTFTLNSSR